MGGHTGAGVNISAEGAGPGKSIEGFEVVFGDELLTALVAVQRFSSGASVWGRERRAREVLARERRWPMSWVVCAVR